MVQDAVIRNLEVIGEAAKSLSDPVRDATPGIPWTDIAGMRDRLIHHYHQVDLDLVWQTVTRDLEALQAAVGSLLSADGF